MLSSSLLPNRADSAQMYKTTKSILADHFGLIVFGAAGFATLWNVLLHNRPLESTSRSVGLWWIALCAVAVLNLCCWRLAAAALAGRKATTDPGVYRFQCWQLVLSAVYVIGCGFRSILPRADVQRIGLFDSW